MSIYIRFSSVLATVTEEGIGKSGEVVALTEYSFAAPEKRLQGTHLQESIEVEMTIAYRWPIQGMVVVQ